MNLLILGAGEYGRLVKELAQDAYSTIAFLDDASDLAIGPLSAYRDFKDRYPNAFVAIGNNEIRMEWIEKLESAGFNLPSIISARAYVSPSALIGPGCCIEPMAVVHTAATVCKGSLICAGAVINHNAFVEAGCHINCNAVVGAHTVVPAKTKLNYCQSLKRNVKY